MGSSPTTARIESVFRLSDEDGTEELRSSGAIDFVRDRSSSLDPMTGCSSISIGDVSYTEVPPGDGVPEGKRWVMYGGGLAQIEAKFEKTLKPQIDPERGMVSTMIVFVVEDPPLDEYVPYLRAHAEVTRVGEEDVRGVPTTRYRTTFDRNAWTRSRLEQAGWKSANIDRYLEQRREPDEEVEVWVDADERIRRLMTRSSSNGPFGRQSSESTTEYFDFGAELDIAAPPAAEVVDADEAFGVSTEDDQDTRAGDDTGHGGSAGDAAAARCT